MHLDTWPLDITYRSVGIRREYSVLLYCFVLFIYVFLLLFCFLCMLWVGMKLILELFSLGYDDIIIVVRLG